MGGWRGDLGMHSQSTEGLKVKLHEGAIKRPGIRVKRAQQMSKFSRKVAEGG